MDIFYNLLGIGAILLGGFFAWRLSLSIVYETQSKTWPTTLGKIVSSSVMSRKHSKLPNDIYWSEIHYSYTVEAEYSSSRVWFAEGYSYNKQEAKQTVSKYPINGVVEVHYNPNKPGIATLETKISILHLCVNFSWLVLIGVIQFCGVLILMQII